MRKFQKFIPCITTLAIMVLIFIFSGQNADESTKSSTGFIHFIINIFLFQHIQLFYKSSYQKCIFIRNHPPHKHFHPVLKSSIFLFNPNKIYGTSTAPPPWQCPPRSAAQRRYPSAESADSSGT